MKMIEERLPGRTEDEERALATWRKDVEVAERRYRTELSKPTPSTERGWFGRRERITSLQAAIGDAEHALAKRLDQLAEQRRELLPDDAEDISLGAGGGGDLWDDRRYPVVCRSNGQIVSLGGCSTLGPAQDRQRWFTNAAKRRS